MKQRGLRRYYRNLGKGNYVDNLDFSGGENSWFDLYHIHIDNRGLGNKSWKSRKQHLDALFTIAEKIELNLDKYPNEFQYWIEIDESDSFEDAIYIHTKNINGSKFPLSIKFDLGFDVKYKALYEYLKLKDYNLISKLLIDDEDEELKTYFLCKPNFGFKIG